MLKFLFVFLITAVSVTVMEDEEVISHCTGKREGILMAVYVSSSTYFIKRLECEEEVQ